MLMKNDSGHTVTLKSLRLRLEPGQTAEIPDGYCLPRRSAGGARVPSVVESLGGYTDSQGKNPCIVPSDPQCHVEWAKAPDLDRPFVGGVPPAKPKAHFMAEGLPEGLAEISAAKEAVRYQAARVSAERAGEQLPQPAFPATSPEVSISKSPKKQKKE